MAEETFNKTKYFTFTQRSPFRNWYVKIHEELQGEARNRMHSMFGPHWAFEYEEDEFLEQIERFGLRELPVGPDIHDHPTFQPEKLEQARQYTNYTLEVTDENLIE